MAPVRRLPGDHDGAHTRGRTFGAAVGAGTTKPLPRIAAPWCGPTGVDVPGALPEGIAGSTGGVDRRDVPGMLSGDDRLRVGLRNRRRFGADPIRHHQVIVDG